MPEIAYYADRPRDKWPAPTQPGERVGMYTIGLDLKALLATIDGEIRGRRRQASAAGNRWPAPLDRRARQPGAGSGRPFARRVGRRRGRHHDDGFLVRDPWEIGIAFDAGAGDAQVLR